MIIAAFSISLFLIIDGTKNNGTGSNAGVLTAANLSGTGTTSDPYLITSAEDLDTFAASVNSGNTYLGKTVKIADTVDKNKGITLGETWDGIGRLSTQFQGVFDGNGCTIKLNNSSVGVFYYIGNGATIKSLITSGNITIESNVSSVVGAIVGFVDTLTPNGGSKVINCANTANITATLAAEANVIIGGIVGECGIRVSIVECYNTGKLKVEIGEKVNHIGNYVGGIVGKVTYESFYMINDCYDRSSGIVGYSTYVNNVGAIVGNNVDVNRCFYVNDPINYDGKISNGAVKVSGADDLITKAEAAGWDFTVNTGTWETVKGQNNGYPVLQVFNLQPLIITEINDINDLESFQNSVSDGEKYSGTTITLMNDITVSSTSWSGIGSSSNPFQGTFNGNGHIITFTNAKSGLFGYVSTGATIKNLGIKGTISVSNGNKTAIGGIVNETPSGSNLYTIKIQNCFNSANITLTSGNGYVGGIAGRAVSGTTISNCYNSGTIKTSSASVSTFIGGIVGTITGTRGNPTISNCYDCSTGSTGGPSANTNTKIGAITGADMTVTNCFYVNAPTNGEIRTQTGLTQVASADDLITKAKAAGWSFTANTGTWETVKGQNNGYPVLQVFNLQPLAFNLTINASVSSGNSMLLLTIVDDTNKVVREIGYSSGQNNVKTTMSLDANATYYLLVTKPFGSNFAISKSGSGLTFIQASGSTTKYILTTQSGSATLTATLTGSGGWKNTVVI